MSENKIEEIQIKLIERGLPFIVTEETLEMETKRIEMLEMLDTWELTPEELLTIELEEIERLKNKRRAERLKQGLKAWRRHR